MRQTHPKLNTRRSVALILATLLLAALLVPSLSVSVSAAESGTCGDGLTWSLSAGTLTISGRGHMTNYTEANRPPWYEYRDRIYRVELQDGIQSIGSLAFYDLKNVQVIYIPDSVLEIAAYAFSECTGLRTVRLSQRLSVIGNSAFYNCSSLMAISLPDNLQTLGTRAFYLCRSLSTVTIPRHISNMGTSVFAYCDQLIQAHVSAQIENLPEWTFYGCKNLTIVGLSDTVRDLDTYAFKNCEVLSTVYYNGTADKKQEIQADLVTDIPSFEQSGTITAATPDMSTTIGSTVENDDGTKTNKSTTVQANKGQTIVAVVEHTYTQDTLSGGSYLGHLSVVIERDDVWTETVNIVKETLKDIGDSCARNDATLGSVDITVYVQTEGGVDPSLVEALAGRDVKMTVVTQNGSESRLECEELKKEELSGSYDYSHSVEAAPADRAESLGTEDCFKVTFNESASVNSEILVQLPQVPAHSNAYLYQVENDDSLTRLQATVVDGNGNAHFYLGSVDKDTEYVVGVNVPGENADDAIIPDELLPHYGDAVERLQKIDYVITGRESSWGLNAAQVTWIMLGVLAVCIIAVGTVMAVWNHNRLKRGYVPNLEDYEEAEAEA